MIWFTSEIEHEGFPLLLRKPGYKNIWDYKAQYSKLLCVTHSLDKVKDNGLPENAYNLLLTDFDHEMCSLFKEKDEGLIILVETFGGKRNYFYYLSSTIDFATKIEAIKEAFNITELIATTNEDQAWRFVDEYPTKLY